MPLTNTTHSALNLYLNEIIFIAEGNVLLFPHVLSPIVSRGGEAAEARPTTSQQMNKSFGVYLSNIK
jgi:hypothetical protein